MTAPTGGRPGEQPLAEVALEKLTRVLGPAKGQRLFDETLRACGVSRIDSPEDLHVFGEELAKRGGFEAAVGRMLTVAAVLRGASGQPPRGRP